MISLRNPPHDFELHVEHSEGNVFNVVVELDGEPYRFIGSKVALNRLVARLDDEISRAPSSRN